ncbi:MAG: glycosyltransferase family 4 protein [Lachnospira sp.]
MNIGILAQKKEKNIDGINRVTIEVLNELLRLDKSNDYSFIGNTHWLGLNLKYNEIIPDTRGIMNLNYTVKFCDYNIIHSHYRAFDFSNNLKCAKILTIHDLLVLKNKYNGPYDYFDNALRKCAKNMDMIIAVSENTKKDIVDLYNIPEKKIRVIYNGVYKKENTIVDNEFVRRFQEEKYIISVSTMREYKNINGLVRAFDIYKKRNKDSELKLILTGKNDNSTKVGKEIEEILMKNTDIIFTGYVSDAELGWLYSNAVCSAFVSFYEGFGLPVLESLSYGKTVICSNTSSMPEIGGQAVEYCNPYDVESIVHAIENVVNNNTRRMELESKALIQANKFSFEKAAIETLELYNSFKK